MENQILQNFYHRSLALYTPQTEKFLDAAQPDIFDHVSFRYTFSVAAMIKISHIIEDATASNRGVADLHVSFQHLSRLIPQQKRYRGIDQAVKRMWLYGIPDIAETEIGPLSRTKFIDTTDTPLVNYWFVVAYGPGIGMSLLAEEIPSLAGSDRYYEGFYTFELDVAYQIIAILHRLYPDSITQPVPPEQLSDR